MVLRNTNPSASGKTPAAQLENVEKSIVLRFEQTVQAAPHRIAVTDSGQALSYHELNAAANRLAAAILRLTGPGDDAPVAMLLGHDHASIVTLLAILKSGRPYLALLPGTPAERLHATLSDAGPVCLISSRRYGPVVQELTARAANMPVVYLEDIQAEGDAANPGIYVAAGSPFGIFYTSGSTGAPKGVVISQRFVNFNTESQLKHLQPSAEDRSSFFASLSFSASWSHVLHALLHGGRLCIFDFRANGPEKALQWIAEQQITLLRLSPTVLRAIFEVAPDGMVFPDIRMVTLGAEPVRTTDAELFKAHTTPQAVLLNTFSSTEAGITAMFAFHHDTVLSGQFLPAGYLTPGQDVMLQDADGQPVAPEETGEIVVRSRYLASGYWKQPVLNAQRFRADPDDPDLKTLATGDLGRLSSDGLLEYLGRKDNMVKIRGYRVELAEVEAAVLRSSLVRETVVVARPSRRRPEQVQLVAYVVALPGTQAAALRAFLAGELPDYAIPSFFVFLESLPLNSNGKVDRKALPDVPDRADPQEADLPADDLEQRLAAIWSAVLKHDRIGVNDNFFELGGDSLSVLSMSIEIERVLARPVPRAFFRDPTIRNLSALLRQGAQDEPAAGFTLEGHRQPSPGTIRRFRFSRRRLKYRLRQAAKDLLRVLSAVFVFESLLALIIRRRSFQEARALVIRLAQQPLVAFGIYAGEYALFRRLLANLGKHSEPERVLFQRSLASNLLFGLFEARRPFNDRPARGPGGRSDLFFRDRRRVIDETPVERLDELVPVNGLHHLQQAHRLGRGVILLSFHGTALNRVAASRLSLRLGGAAFQTIAHNLAHKQSYLWDLDLGPEMSDAQAGSLYAEIALHGLRVLQQGEIVHISGDISKGPGRTYPMRIGDREYAIRPGFAELALNAGAPVIPLYGRFLEDGRLMTELGEPLDPGSGSRDEQLEALVRRYAAFINEALSRHPQIWTWKRIRNHLHLPRTRGRR